MYLKVIYNDFKPQNRFKSKVVKFVVMPQQENTEISMTTESKKISCLTI